MLHTLLLGLQNQATFWALVGVVVLLILGWFAFVMWALDSTASYVYRTDGQPVPPIVEHPTVTTLKGSGAKGFQFQRHGRGSAFLGGGDDRRRLNSELADPTTVSALRSITGGRR